MAQLNYMGNKKLKLSGNKKTKIAKALKICYTKIRQKKKEGQNKCGNKQKRVAFYALRLQGKPI